MHIRPASDQDILFLIEHDCHVSAKELKSCIHLGRIYVAESQGTLLGWLRYNLFWDNTPFMNMLYVLEDHRNQTIGSQLVQHWEHEMKHMNYTTVMTSTSSAEYAQHFYQHRGYRAIGGFIIHNDPYEILFAKEI